MLAEHALLSRLPLVELAAAAAAPEDELEAGGEEQKKRHLNYPAPTTSPSRLRLACRESYNCVEPVVSVLVSTRGSGEKGEVCRFCE